MIANEGQKFILTHISRVGNTYVNDEAVGAEGRISLAKGDVIKIGKSVITVTDITTLPMKPCRLTLKIKHTKKLINIDSQVFSIGRSYDSNLIVSCYR